MHPLNFELVFPHNLMLSQGFNGFLLVQNRRFRYARIDFALDPVILSSVGMRKFSSFSVFVLKVLIDLLDYVFQFRDENGVFLLVAVLIDLLQL